MYADPCFNRLTRGIYLPKPIFRYDAIFPSSFVKKMRGHSQLYKNETDWPDEVASSLERLIDEKTSIDQFWEKASRIYTEIYRRGDWPTPEYPKELMMSDISEHPKVMQDILRRPDEESYTASPELLREIQRA